MIIPDWASIRGAIEIFREIESCFGSQSVRLQDFLGQFKIQHRLLTGSFASIAVHDLRSLGSFRSPTI
jgi:hypothetical protein